MYNHYRKKVKLAVTVALKETSYPAPPNRANQRRLRNEALEERGKQAVSPALKRRMACVILDTQLAPIHTNPTQ